MTGSGQEGREGQEGLRPRGRSGAQCGLNVESDDPAVETRAGARIDRGYLRIVSGDDMVRGVRKFLDRRVPFQYIANAIGDRKHPAVVDVSVQV